MPSIKQEKWNQAWTAEQPLFKQYAQLERLIQHRDIAGNAAEKCLIYAQEGYVRSYLPEHDYELIQRDGQKLLRPEIAVQTTQSLRQTLESFWEIAKRVRLLALKDEDLQSRKFSKTMESFDAELIKIFAYFFTTWEATSHYPEKALTKKVREEFPDSTEDVLTTLLTPVDEDLLLREKRSWLDVVKDPSRAKIEEHMLNYAFLFTNLDSEEDALQLMEDRLRKGAVKEIRTEVENAEVREQEIRERQKHILRSCTSPDIGALSRLLRDFALLRLELKAAWSGIHYYLHPLYERIAEEVSMDRRDVMMYWTMKETVRYMKGGEALSKTETKKRKDFYLLFLHDRHIELLTGPEAKRKKDDILSIGSRKEIYEFQGSVACRGEAHGKVALVQFDDLKRIESLAKSLGEKIILVVGMTNPNMMPLIRKAKAIITNEGGITCHAAIISREFGIPCIIGTKIATDTLRDGDIVEVDALQKGIVRIISRAKQ